MDLQANLSRGATWIRGLYMLLFAILFNIAELVLAAVAIFQFLAQLLTGGVNRRLQGFGANLAEYLRQVADFLTYAGETKPFPFGRWPGPVAEGENGSEGPMGPGTGGEPNREPAPEGESNPGAEAKRETESREAGNGS